jgi:predicted dehydrogenase
MKPIRMAVIGAGRLGGFHAQKAAASKDIELAGAVDPVAENRNRVAAECNTKALHDVDQLDGKIDAAIIAAPTRFHHRLAMKLIEQGIHLLVEKPLCPTLAEADELVDAAHRRGVVLQVGHVEQFSPALAAALPYVPAPKYIEAVRAGGFTFRSTDIGVVLDLMIHDIDLVLSMVQSPLRRVEAVGLSVLGGHEDVANARLHFESGCIANLNASRVSPTAGRQMQIWSGRGFANIDFGALKTTVVEPSEELLRRRFDVDSLSPQMLEHHKEHFQEEHLPVRELQSQRVDALVLQQCDFVESIRMPRAPRVSGEQARDAVALAERILQKIQSHAWDDSSGGPVGPMAVPRPSVLPIAPVEAPFERKEAG